MRHGITGTDCGTPFCIGGGFWRRFAETPEFPQSIRRSAIPVVRLGKTDRGLSNFAILPYDNSTGNRASQAHTVREETMSIQIPCPKCGRELKLPDRSLLGRKGKCPKCAHTFVLEEPPVVALELANPEPVAASAQVFAENRSTPVRNDSPSPAVSQAEPFRPEAVIPPELAVLDQLAKPKGAAARLKELQKKNARRRNIGLAIGGVILAAVGAVVMFAPQFAAKNQPAKITDSTAETKSKSGEESQGASALGVSQKGSPTKGKPIELQYIPFGTQVVLNLRPAELWKKESLGEELRYCVPPLAKLIETTLEDLFQRKPEDVEELLICLLPGVRGSLPDVAAVVHMVQDQKRSQLIEQFGERIDTYEHPIYVSRERAYMIVDQKTFAVCPKSQAQEMVQAINDRHPVEQIDPLLGYTDRDRHITAIFTPMTLSLQETWFPENVRPFVKNALDWLGDEVETGVWSFHLTDELFFSEILLRPKNASGKNSVKKLEREFQDKLSQLAQNLVPLFELMNPQEQGKRMVIGRVPAMVEVFSMATVTRAEKQHIQLVTSLPDRAAPNLALGTLLAWDESTRTDFSKERSKPAVPETMAVPDKIADRLKLKIDVDFRRTPLNEAFTFIGGEIKTPIEIDGDGLKLGGFTKNIAQVFKMDATRAQDVIVKIFEESKGVNQPPDKTLVVIVDESKKSLLITTLAVANDKGMVPYDLTK